MIEKFLEEKGAFLIGCFWIRQRAAYVLAERCAYLVLEDNGCIIFVG
jgi:hypothetical protein